VTVAVTVEVTVALAKASTVTVMAGERCARRRIILAFALARARDFRLYSSPMPNQRHRHD